VPADEPARLAALQDAQVLDTPPEEDFDDIALLASEICHTPMGLVSLVDQDRQWFKAKIGVDASEAPRDLSFCAYTINGPGLLEVRDARADQRFADNPYVMAEEGLRFYAGAPVVLDGRHSVGTVCVVDTVPRTLNASQRTALRSLARHASAQLELRRHARHAGELADRLRDLDQIKDTFLVSVSHEFRTPLSSINGYLEILLEGGYDEDTSHRFLTIMQRNSTRLLRLVEELLLVARLTENGMDLDISDLDLAELVRTAIDVARPVAEARGVHLLDRSDDGRAPVRGDARRLGQALDHLLANAIKFTDPGGEVSVRTQSGGRPSVAITDTGIGITSKDLPYVCDRFYRAKAAEVMAAPGPGLGLAIVQAITDAHEGSLALESEPGVGTTVHLTLPNP
jgi:signal transduction histidine kinase